MKIIIAGAGEVGFHLAKLLSFESQDITLIDTHKESLAYADSHLDKETVKFSELGSDELISPEELAAAEIQLLLGKSAFNDTYDFEDGKLIMIGVSLLKSAPFVGKMVKEAAKIFSELHFMPIALKRLGTQFTVIPRGDTVFKEGDQVYFITTSEGVDELYKLSDKKKEEIKNVMILGGSQVGFKTARDLCNNRFNVKLVEKHKEKAFDLADDLPNALIINGDGRNVELLQEESLESMDAFIAVTGNSETNIMSCLVAKSKHVKKTIALVENMDYFQLSHSIGIDTLINKKLLAANNIFRHIRKGEVVASMRLNNLNAEILEFVVKPNSKVTGSVIRELDFPKSATIGGVVRDGKGIIALGDFKIEAGDRVLVCCLPKEIAKIEKLFL